MLAYAPGGRSLRRLAAEAAAAGVVDVSDVALLERFRGCGDWVIALCENLLANRDAPAGDATRQNRVRVLITSLDALAFPPRTLVWLYRVRWQIELAFKRLKSILRLDRLPAKDPGLARAWIAAHLLLALLIEDTTAETAAFAPCGP